MYAEFRALEFHTGTAFLQSAPASSDISVWQCLGPLLTGGRTVFADYSTLCSAVDLFGLIREEEVTLIELVPVVLEGLIHFAETQPGELSRLPKLERAMVTGEAVSATLVRRWFGIWPGVPLINAYGPTEAADDICQYEMREAPDPSTAVVPIGTPVDNMSVMVLDSRGELLPAGLPGEICVSGIGVGDGYWRQAENTAAAFVPNPLRGATLGDVLYKTGDLGRWRGDGVLEFLGRLDHQVKIRGFRVELGEIEAALNSHPNVRESLAVAYEEPGGERRLAAYVRADAQGSLSLELSKTQVDLWKALHDKSYGESGPTSGRVRFDTIGWDSTYTGEPLSSAEMRECVGNAVSRIQALRPKNLIEIGCGTGLLLFRLAARCRKYVGTDLSESAVGTRFACRPPGTVPGMENLELRCQAANDFSGFEPGLYDTVVLNSVVQYLPGVNDLLDFLREAASRCTAGASIFLGDLRSLPLLGAYHTSVQEAKASDETTAAVLRDRIAAQRSREQELAVDPRLFIKTSSLPRITETLLRPKRGRIHNEMTRFRFDVVLSVGSGRATEPCSAEFSEDWRDREPSAPQLWQRLDRTRPEYLLLRFVLNARLTREYRIGQWLASAPPSATVGALRRWLAQTPASPALPVRSCGDCGAHCRTAWKYSLSRMTRSPLRCCSAIVIQNRGQWILRVPRVRPR